MFITQLDGACFIRYRPKGFSPGGIPDASKPMIYNCLEVPRDPDWIQKHGQTLIDTYNTIQAEKSYREFDEWHIS